jgi:putative sulfotransferase
MSRMLGEHPDVLSLFEFFTGLDWDRRFTSEPMSGREFRDMVSAEQPVVTAVLRRGYEVSEITYPFDGVGRYQRDDPLPWILVSMLPRLGDDPDALYEQLTAELDSAPSLAPVDHYRRMFEWLGRRFGRRHWIERSGSSVEYADELARLFPNARFVHLHRDGAETALSMREHHAYRLPICLLYDAPLDDGTPVSELPALDVNAAPTGDDPVTRILQSRPPGEYFGRYWNDQIVKGMAALDGIAEERVLSVAFEELIGNPKRWLSDIAEFFELERESDGWIEKGAALVRGVVPTRADELSRDEYERLIDACAPGSRLLGR